MKKFKIVAVIPTLKDEPSKTIESILQQTVKISDIIVITGSKELYRNLLYKSSDFIEVIYVKPNMNNPVGKRVATALNVGLSRINLEEYEYILRVDADVILPSCFVEKNLKANADYVGKAGYAMLIKTSTFLDIFNGKFAEVGAEDSYFGLKLLYLGYQVKQWLCPPVLMRKSGQHHSFRYYFNRGVEMYRLGYEPIHVFETTRRDLRNIFCIIGYTFAAIKKIDYYEFAHWVFRKQLKRLIYGKT